MTPLINRGHGFFLAMQKYDSVEHSLYMNTGLSGANSFPETHSHHSELLLYKQMDFHSGSGLAESLDLYSVRQKTNGEIFKDKGRQYQTP